MITISREWLMKTIAELEEERDATPGAVNEDAAMALAAMKLALASLEARSRKLFTCSACGAEGLDEPLESKCHCNEDGAHWIESVVYTAPPAPVVSDIGEIRVGRLPTMNQDDYPGLGDWWVHLRTGKDSDEVLARVYGATPQEANSRAEALACRAAMLQGAELVKAANKLTEETGSSLQLRNLIRQRHAEWSQATFGGVGPVGPLKHLSKEALEAAEEPDDLSEWADMQFLLWDAQRRAGITDEEITAALEEKLKVNMARQWPEPKDGEPRMHIKAAPRQQVK